MQRSYSRQRPPPSSRRLVLIREPRPGPHQPGTLLQQFEAIDLFLSNPFRRIDREAAWHLARRLAIPHARRAVA